MFAIRIRIAGAALLLGAAACSRPESKSTQARESAGFRGVVVTPPRAKPDFALPDQNGKLFDFKKETEGKVALLFFGYTHCPDVCPLHVANVAAVLKRMSFEDRAAVRFVFVTTDPKRDTPARLKEWLGSFDPSFVGLTAPPERVNQLLAELRMPPIENDPKPTDSVTYLVGHAAQVLAFGKDGLGRLEYPFGVRQEDWAHDLPLLARGVAPESNDAVQRSGPGAVALEPLNDSAAQRALGARAIHVLAALVPQPPTTSEGAVYLVLQNDGAVDDTLTAVWSDAARKAEVHETMKSNGASMSHMSAVPFVVVGAHATVRLEPGGRHVMLLQLAKRPAVGESIPLQLRFAKAGDVALGAEVVAYADVEGRLRRVR